MPNPKRDIIVSNIPIGTEDRTFVVFPSLHHEEDVAHGMSLPTQNQEPFFFIFLLVRVLVDLRQCPVVQVLYCCYLDHFFGRFTFSSAMTAIHFGFWVSSPFVLWSFSLVSGCARVLRRTVCIYCRIHWSRNSIRVNVFEFTKIPP